MCIRDRLKTSNYRVYNCLHYSHIAFIYELYKNEFCLSSHPYENHPYKINLYLDEVGQLGLWVVHACDEGIVQDLPIFDMAPKNRKMPELFHRERRDQDELRNKRLQKTISCIHSPCQLPFYLKVKIDIWPNLRSIGLKLGHILFSM